MSIDNKLTKKECDLLHWITLKAYETRKKALTDALPKATILDQQKIPVELAADEELADLMLISRKLASMEVA
tara:strand:- start:1126 stop:1341 length:216 start_codon:yes stop_codon:yes gene_type:complete